MTKEWVFDQIGALWLLLPFFIFVAGELYFRKRPWFLAIPRALWILSLTFLLLDLNGLDSVEYRQQGKIYFVWDESDSVARIPERVARVSEFRKEMSAWAREGQQKIETFALGESLRPAGWDEPLRGGFKTPASALASIPQMQDGAIIFLSDGNLSGTTALKSPVISVQVGDPDEKDLWFENVKSVFTAFLKNRIKLPIEIGQRGYLGKEVRVRLWRANEAIYDQVHKLVADTTSLEIPYFPERMGEELLRIEIEPLSGELSDINNSFSFRVRTVRDKIRILHICGRPDIDLKAWRIFLTRQPDVDLVSFYILRSLQDEPGARNNELSLIPFPYDELFSVELEKFDIVVLQNFNFNLYFQAFYLRNLAEFISKGGSLLIFGGDQSLQNYKDSPLDPLFPFRFSGQGDFMALESRVKVSGKHPITKSLESSFEGRLWTHRHRLTNEPEAEDLVKFADGSPFLSIRQVAEGRVVSWNTDESWRLHFEPGADSAAFGKVARRLLQYLTFDPEMETQKILSSAWQVGQKVKLQHSQKSNALWKVEDVRTQKILYASKSLESEIEFVVPDAGVYSVRAGELPVQVFETEEKPWLNEWKNLLARDEKLKSLADQTRGKLFSYQDRKKVFKESISSQQMIAANVNPWSHENLLLSWGYLLLTLLFLFVDFYLRKKFQWDA